MITKAVLSCHETVSAITLDATHQALANRLSFLGVAVLVTSMMAASAHAQTSTWAHYDSNGVLQYGTTANGDRLMDFSTAGYAAGARVIPNIPMAFGENRPLTPKGAGQDDSAQINAEITRVAGLPLGSNGFRGAVVLGPGTFNITAYLSINASGIVLRGSGASTILNIDTSGTKQVKSTPCGSSTPVTQTVANNFAAITVYGNNNFTLTGTPASLTDSYAPSGTAVYHVYPHSLFTVGEKVVVRRPVTEPWKQYLGMDVFDNALSCSSDPNSRAPWLNTPLAATPTLKEITTTSEGQFERTVVAQDTYTVTLDAPIPDSFDRLKTTNSQGNLINIVGVIQPYTYSERISNVGVENLAIEITSGYVPVESDGTKQPFEAVNFASSFIDGWVRNVTAHNTFNSFETGSRVSQVTYDNVNIIQDLLQGEGGQFSHFTIGYLNERLLIHNSTINGSHSVNSFFVETSTLSSGPNVVLNDTFTGTGDVGGHQRWATGMLADNVTLNDVHNANTFNHYVSFSARNTGAEGTAHGWASAWNVVWNSTAQQGAGSPGHEFLIESPAGATNWCIGCIGPDLSTTKPTQPPANLGTVATPPVGIADSHGVTVQPQSLYVAQLLERIGTFQIINANSGLALTDQSGVEVQEPYTAAANQQWTFVPVGGTPGSYTVVNGQSHQLLNLTTGAYGTQATTIACGVAGQPACTTNQQFTITPGFELYSVRFSEPLVVSGDSLAVGASIIEELQGRQPKSQEWYLAKP